MNFDFDARESKFDRERRLRAEAARKKRAEEEARQAQHARKQQELLALAEEALRLRQEEAERAEERAAAEATLTGGIKCCNTIKGVADASEAEDDKIILPQSVFDTLNAQDAFSRGVMYFRLTSTTNGRVTHAGVREFTAKEGEVVLPQKVFDSLSAPPITPTASSTTTAAPTNTVAVAPAAGADSSLPFSGSVEVKYVRLPKITHVKFQPVEHSFYEIENVKMMLEENLRRHSALTIGDVVAVWFRGKKYTLRAVDVQPEPQGSLIDTDVEIDLDESVEYKASLLRKRQAEEQAASSRGRQLGSATAASASGPPIPPILGNAELQAAAGTGSVTAGRVLGRQAADRPPEAPQASSSSTPMAHTSQISLPPEPPAGEQGVIACKFRISAMGGAGGGSMTRRFLTSDAAESLFHFLRAQPAVSAQLAAGARSLQLTTRFPNRTIAESDVSLNDGLKPSLASLGLTSSIDFIVSVV